MARLLPFPVAIKKPNYCWAFWIVTIYFIRANDLILASNASSDLLS